MEDNSLFSVVREASKYWTTLEAKNLKENNHFLISNVYGPPANGDKVRAWRLFWDRENFFKPKNWILGGGLEYDSV